VSGWLWNTASASELNAPVLNSGYLSNPMTLPLRLKFLLVILTTRYPAAGPGIPLEQEDSLSLIGVIMQGMNLQDAC
jgi:hypothetical protein